MCDSIKILCCIKAVNPQSFLPRLLESRVVSFSFGSQGVNLLEGNTLTINGKSVIIRERNIFCAAPMLLAVVPVFMIAGTGSTFGVFHRTAIFLTCPAVVRQFAVFVHSKTRFTNWMSA